MFTASQSCCGLTLALLALALTAGGVQADVYRGASAGAVVVSAAALSATDSRVRAGAAAGASAGANAGANFAGHAASADARRLADWIVASRDNRQAPFAILDKRDARVFAFDASGRLVDSSPALLGSAIGDESVPGIGERALAQVRPHERTTPAGRFNTEPGRNASGEQVIWLDYDAAVSMHRVRLGNVREQRLARLASPDPAMRRISFGCVNLPVAFFDAIIWPAFGHRRGVMYVLPETRPVQEVFPALVPATLKQPG